MNELAAAGRPAPMIGTKELEQALLDYEVHGFAGPFRAFGALKIGEAAAAVAAEVCGKRPMPFYRNRHLDWDVARSLIQAPEMRALAAALLGPRLVLWRSHLFAARFGRGLPWHQDEYLTLLANPDRQVSLHLALTPSTVENCIMLVPGSHRMSREQLAARGFNFTEGSDGGAYGAPTFWRSPGAAQDVRKMLLRPGEFFAFHPRLMHASRDVVAADALRAPTTAATAPSPESDLRLGIALRITDPENEVFPAAFAETLPRDDRCIRMDDPSWLAC